MDWLAWLIIELAMPASAMLASAVWSRVHQAKQQGVDLWVRRVGVLVTIVLVSLTTGTLLLSAWVNAWNATGQALPSILWVIARAFGAVLILSGAFALTPRDRIITPNVLTFKPVTRTEKLRQNGGHHTGQEWRELCVKYNHRCLACNQRQPLTKDHIIPVHLGGSDDISNIQPLCRSCNSSKNTRIIDYRPQAASGELPSAAIAAVGET